MDIIPAGLDSFSDGEFTDIRRKLRLGSWWKVTGVRTTVNLPGYEDLPDSGPNTGTETRKTEIPGHTYIRVEADRKRRYRCPNCGRLAPIYQMGQAPPDPSVLHGIRLRTRGGCTETRLYLW